MGELLSKLDDQNTEHTDVSVTPPLTARVIHDATWDMPPPTEHAQQVLEHGQDLWLWASPTTASSPCSTPGNSLHGGSLFGGAKPSRRGRKRSSSIGGRAGLQQALQQARQQGPPSSHGGSVDGGSAYTPERRGSGASGGGDKPMSGMRRAASIGAEHRPTPSATAPTVHPPSAHC